MAATSSHSVTGVETNFGNCAKTSDGNDIRIIYELIATDELAGKFLCLFKRIPINPQKIITIKLFMKIF